MKLKLTIDIDVDTDKIGQSQAGRLGYRRYGVIVRNNSNERMCKPDKEGISDLAILSHEIGHIVYDALKDQTPYLGRWPKFLDSGYRPVGLVLENERGAWESAKAIFEFVMKKALGTYEYNFGHKPPQEKVYFDFSAKQVKEAFKSA